MQIQQIFANAYKQLRGKEGRFVITFYPYTTIKHTIRKRRNIFYVRLSDLVQNENEEIINAIAFILISKIEKLQCPREQYELYKNYTCKKEVVDNRKAIRKIRAKEILPNPIGIFYDLRISFNRVNAEYFKGELKNIKLKWTKRKIKSQLGYYDIDLDAIVINKVLDDRRIPQFVLDFVMYHELLHVKIRSDYKKFNEKVHTKEFKIAERKFRFYEQSKVWIDRIMKKLL